MQESPKSSFSGQTKTHKEILVEETINILKHNDDAKNKNNRETAGSSLWARKLGTIRLRR